MSTRHALTAFRAFVLTTVAFLMLASVSSARQQVGTLAGTATDEASQPYSNYDVRARDTALTQIAETVQLAADGTFSITGLILPSNYLIELYDRQRDSVVCTEGPFNLSEQIAERLNIDVDCGIPPIAWWLLGAGGVAAGTAVALQSNAQ